MWNVKEYEMLKQTEIEIYQLKYGNIVMVCAMLHNVCIARKRSSHWKCSVKTGALKNFAIYKRKHLGQSLFSIKFLTFHVCNFIKRSLQHRCSPGNIAKFLRTPIFKNICERLLLKRLSLQPSLEINRCEIDYERVLIFLSSKSLFYVTNEFIFIIQLLGYRQCTASIVCQLTVVFYYFLIDKIKRK